MTSKSILFLIVYFYFIFVQAQSRACQLSRESYLSLYRDYYVQSIDRQIYPLSKPIQNIVPPHLDPGFRAQICSSIQLTPVEIRNLQIEIYEQYFGSDDADHPTRAKLKNFFVQSALSSEVLQSFGVVNDVRTITQQEKVPYLQKYQQLMQYMNGLSQHQLRLYFDSSLDAFAFVAEGDFSIEAYIQNLNRAYPSANEFVAYLSRFSLMSDEEYSSLGAQQLRKHLSKSLQSVQMNAKMACIVSEMASRSLVLNRTGLEYEDLVDTLFTLFPETEKYSDTVCNEREVPPVNVKALRKTYLAELGTRQPKPKRLSLNRGIQKNTASNSVTVTSAGPEASVRCVERELINWLQSELRTVHPMARSILGFSDSRGCSYTFDLSPKSLKTGVLKIEFRVRVSHPTFIASGNGDFLIDSRVAAIFENIRRLGIQFDRQ